MRRDRLERANAVTLRHVQTVRKGGRVYRYLRTPGRPRVRLPDLPPDDPRFLAAYAAALAESAPRPARHTPGTIGHLVELYLASARHADLAADYRRVIRREADAIRAKAGTARARDLQGQHLRADLAYLAPHRAAARLKAWRAILSYAVATGTLTADPSDGLRVRTPPAQGHPAWSHDDVAAFRARWPLGTTERLALELAAWTGARISDLVTLGPPLIGRDGVLAYRQSKTGGMAYVPWTCPLPPFASPADRDHVHAAIAARPSGHLTWLATAQGTTRSHKALGHVIAAAARAAGVAKSAHGLRKYRAASLAEAGATSAQLGAWTGHASLSEVEHYTRSADRRRLVTGTEPGTPAVNTPAPACKPAP